MTAQTQERFREDLRRPLSLYFRLISGTGQNKTKTNTVTKQPTLGKGDNLISRAIISFKCPVFNKKKNHKAYKQLRKYGSFERKRNQQKLSL